MRKIAGLIVWVVAVLLVASVTMTLICGCEPDADGAGENPEPLTGYALAIGLNEVNPAYYGGWRGELCGCEPDAIDMKEIAIKQGLNVEVLLTKDATRDAVLNKLDDLAKKLKSGDLLVVSYSGHGGQIPDQNGDEADGLDETWCLYDGELLDDELHGAWMKFQDGVRILALSDSCHSGTVLKMKKIDMENPPASRPRELDKMWEHLRVPPKLDRVRMLSLPELREAIPVRPYLRERIKSLPPSAEQPSEPARFQPVEPAAERVFVSRSIPPGVSIKTYEQNRIFYDALGKSAPRQDSDQVKASVILVSACEDTQTAADLGFNGLFTWTLKKAWNNGAFTGDHLRFCDDIRERVKQQNPDQVPCIRYIGAFIGQRPYTIEGPGDSH
jgi:hypothetical protein